MTLEEMKLKRAELKRKYDYAARRHADLRTRVVPPEQEPLRQKLMYRWAGEKLRLNHRVNELGVKIWKAEKEAEQCKGEHW